MSLALVLAVTVKAVDQSVAPKWFLSRGIAAVDEEKYLGLDIVQVVSLGIQDIPTISLTLRVRAALCSLGCLAQRLIRYVECEVDPSLSPEAVVILFGVAFGAVWRRLSRKSRMIPHHTLNQLRLKLDWIGFGFSKVQAALYINYCITPRIVTGCACCISSMIVGRRDYRTERSSRGATYPRTARAWSACPGIRSLLLQRNPLYQS